MALSRSNVLPSRSFSAPGPKPGIFSVRATANRKDSRLIGSPAAFLATRGSTTGERTVEVFATTSAQGTEMPQLS